VPLVKAAEPHTSCPKPGRGRPGSGRSRTIPDSLSTRRAAPACYPHAVARSAYALAALILLAAACGEDPPAPSPAIPADAAPTVVFTPADAASAPEDDRPEIAPPSDTFHLDAPSIRRTGPAAAAVAPARRLEITLRSTPSRARVMVDGEPVGQTPAYWEGEADGQPREFTFVLPGYEMARYRFVPTRSGIVHATLERIPGAVPADAGPPAP
jgi:hypothetical protein